VALRHGGEQYEPVAIPVAFGAGGEEPVLGGGERAVSGRRDVPPGTPSDTQRLEQARGGAAGQCLAGRLLLEADHAEGVHDGLGPRPLSPIERVVAEQEQ
jgi:hypothetical protein